ncbi:hypothetical protein C8R44DRAFT_70859 [Mycena epipterygia]|nr:hypothetical protein C8R44DRAFT_70859 [Mycena epipterygia]
MLTASADWIYPVFYALLDPARIPGIFTEIDSAPWPSSDDSPSVSILISLNVFALSIRSLVFPDAAYPDLWARTWPWAQFTSTYRESLLGIHPWFPEKTISTDHVSTILHLKAHSQTATVINATPGVYVVLARAWVVLLQAEDWVGLQDVCRLLGDIAASDPKNIAELVDGVGGNVEDLATVILQHIARVLGPDERVTATTGSLVKGILNLLHGRDRRNRINAGDPLDAALLAQKIMRGLTAILYAFAKSTVHDAGEILEVCTRCLMYRMLIPPGYCWVTEALSSGLLLATIVCSTSHTVSVQGFLRPLLRTILPPCTAYRSTLSEMRYSFFRAREYVDTVEFRGSEIFPEWEAFAALANDRMHVLQSHEDGLNVAEKGCDNMDCGKIGYKQDFKRCSSCHKTYYCSTACQAIDWRGGDHRAESDVVLWQVIPSLSVPGICRSCGPWCATTSRCPRPSSSWPRWSSCTTARTCRTACDSTTRLVNQAYRSSEPEPFLRQLRLISTQHR